MRAERSYTPLWALGWRIPLALAAVVSTPALGQDWSPSSSFDAGEFPADRQPEVAVSGELIALAFPGAEGGVVQLRWRHQGGLDQWGVLAAVQSAVPWFGSVLAFGDGRLAIGAPGAAGSGAFSGAVQLHSTGEGPGEDPLEHLQTLEVPGANGGDRSGIRLLWLGDTLAVAAVGRSGSRAIGSIFLFAPDGDGLMPLQEAILPASSQVPYLRWFGARMATKGDRLLIAAPWSGFEIANPRQQVGSLHLFHHVPFSSPAWEPDTAWVDLALDTSTTCAFARMELGRWGVAFVNGGFMLDHARGYDGGDGTALEPWPSPEVPSGACPACGLRMVREVAGSWDLASATAPMGTGEPWQRAARGWCAAGDSLVISQLDPGTGSWSVTLHRRDAGGADAWGPHAVLQVGDPCDRPVGPMAMDTDRLAIVKVRTGADCAVPDGHVRVIVDVFDR